MKRFIKNSLMIVSLATIIGSSSLQAATLNLVINGEKISCSVSPLQKNNTTLVPFRVIGENLGAKVEWISSKQQVVLTNQNNKIILTVGNKTAIVNDENKNLTVPPQIINGTVMVPARFVSENLDADVKWNSNTQTVSISSNKNASATTDHTDSIVSHKYHWGINEYNDEYGMIISISTQGAPTTVDSTMSFKVENSIYDYKLFTDVKCGEYILLNKENAPDMLDPVNGGDGIFGFVGDTFSLKVSEDSVQEGDVNISFNYTSSNGDLYPYIVTWKKDGSIVVNKGDLIAK